MATVRSSGRGYLPAVALTVLCTVLAAPLFPHIAAVNIVMVYLLGSTLGALWLRRGPSALTAALNVLTFDFFYVPPLYSFDVDDAEYGVTLVVMLVVALVIAELMRRLRRQTEIAGARERRTAVLYEMTRELAVAGDVDAIAAVAVRHVREVFNCAAAVCLADQGGAISPIAVNYLDYPALRVDLAIAQAVAAGPARRRSGDAVYLPLPGAIRVVGVLAVKASPGRLPPADDALRLMDSFAAQIALSLERARLAAAAEAAHLAAERAALRNTLLASISHDLRTPLTAIAGAGSLLAQSDYTLNTDRRTTLGQLIEKKAHDMSQQLSNVLELMRLEFGAGPVRAEWHAVEDLVSLALCNNQARTARWRLMLDVPSDLPLILVEETLVLQILNNLLENVTKHTPPGTTISLSASVRAEAPPAKLVMVVEDDGPGLPPGDAERLFDKFERGRDEGNVSGVGLGLAICRAAARLLGGEIRAMASPLGGARFEIALPVAHSA